MQTRIERAFVHPHVRAADYDTARRGRLQASFILAFISLPLSFLTLGVILGGFGASMFAMVVEIFVLAAALVVLRVRGALAVSGNTLVAVFYAVTMVAVVPSGGLTTSNAAWLLLVPLMALLLVGAKSGLVWLTAIVASVITLARLHGEGIIAPAELPPSLAVLATSINVVGCTVVAFGCAWLYESSKRHMLAQVDTARRDAEHAFTGARLVLDHIEEALMMVRRDGTIEPECSAAVARLLGGLDPTATIWELFARTDARTARWVELGWPDIFADVMPVELVLAQLPSRLEGNGRVLGVTYALVSSGERVLVMVRDMTAAEAAEAAERDERQVAQLLARLARDRATFLGFWDELADLVGRVGDPSRARELAARDLHTLKGNAGLLGLDVLARLCHDAEDRGVEAGVALTADDRVRIATAFAQLDERLRAVVGVESDAISVPRIEYDALVAAALERSPHDAFTSTLLAWGQDPIAPQLELLAERSRRLAHRLGKGDIVVEVDDGCARVPHASFAPFFTALAHVVRNAVDHGLERADERERAGKPSAGRLRLGARIRRGDLVVEVADDGRGIDWQRVAAKTAALGLPHRDRLDLVAALFADGVSSRDEVTTSSGRGVGLAAVWAATHALDGRIEVDSEAGAGTRFTFVFPAACLVDARERERAAHGEMLLRAG